jgi:uncharacterized protein (DUF362 family)
LKKENVFQKDGVVLVSKVNASADLKKSIENAVDLIGGFKKVISSGDRVIVKPNFNSDDPFPASSDPEFVRTVVFLLYHAGASRVIIVESSGMPWLPTRNVLEKTGMLKAAQECNAEVRILDQGEWVDIAIEGKRWKKISIAKDALDEDARFVWLPCMKTHRYASFSLSLKLAVGLLDFRLRGDLHSAHLEEKIAELNLAVHPDLIIMDGRKCFVTGGPDVGRVEEPNIILASGDRIAIDVEAIKVIESFEGASLEADPWSYIQIRRAVELGVGVKSERDYKVIKRSP